MGTSLPQWRQRATKLAARVVGISLLFTSTTAGAQSSLNPTLLVNTEAFFQLSAVAGENTSLEFGSSSNYLRFLTTNLFEFSHGIVVNGNANVRGTLSGQSLLVNGTSTLNGATTITGNTRVRGNLSGSTLNVDGTAAVNGATTINGLTTVNANVKVRGNLSGSTLYVDGNSTIRGSESISGTLGVTGNVTTNANLTINNDADSNNAVLTFGNISGNQTVTYSNALQRFEFSRATWINGNLSASGTLATQGNITTRADLTINADNDTNNAVLTFGNNTAAQNLTYNNALQAFTFSRDVRVTGGVRASGNLSGATLTVDGAVTLRGQTYNFPTAQTANGFLRTDGAGNLTWTTSLSSGGSGSVVSLHPEYPGAVYFGSGSAAVGSLSYIYDSANRENAYRWISSRATLQDYWISTRVMVPKNFTSMDANALKFRYRTLTTSAAQNFVSIFMLDTTGAPVTLTGNTGLTSSVANTWATSNIARTGGTFTPGGYITVLVRVSATNAGAANPGYIDINWKTTTP